MTVRLQGVIGSGDWTSDERPKSWRELILFLYPNGSMPLTALMSKLGSEKVDDPEFNWFEKRLPTQRGVIASVTTVGGGGYTGGAAAGTELLVTLGLPGDGDTIQQSWNRFRIGHVVMLRTDGHPGGDRNAIVTTHHTDTTGPIITYCLTVKLVQSDALVGIYSAATADVLLIIGNANQENSSAPTAISYGSKKNTNYTQIFRSSLEMSRTAQMTRLRTGDQYREAKRETLEIHGIEMEKAFIFGYPYEDLSGDKPLRLTRGLINTVVTNTGTLFDYNSHPDYAGMDWLTGGEAFLDEVFEKLFRYGANEKIAFCGSGAMLGINKLAKAAGQIQLTPDSTSYGLKVQTWITPQGTVHLKTHPLFSYEATNRYMIVPFEPKNYRFRPITDTTFKRNLASNDVDGMLEGFLTEAGLEHRFEETSAVIRGVGIDN